MENYHLVHDGQNWVLKKEKATRATKVFDNTTKADAIKQLKNTVSNASVKIHKLDGKIQEERTYPRSIDPRKSKG